MCEDPGKGDATLGVGGPGPPGRVSEHQLIPDREEGRHSKMTEDKEDGSIMTSRDSYAQSECRVHYTMNSIMYIMYPHYKNPVPYCILVSGK